MTVSDFPTKGQSQDQNPDSLAHGFNQYTTAT